MLKVGVSGAAGRMGRLVISEIAFADDLALAGAIERPGSELLGSDAGVIAGCAPLGMAITEKVAEVVARSEVIIDFSSPLALAELRAACTAARVPLVIGTTG